MTTQEGALYYYLVSHLDSLDSKYALKIDKDWGTTEWEQHFNYGVYYYDWSVPEKGGGGSLRSQCYDQSKFTELLSGILCFGADRNVWNEDSTKYEPKDQGAGCYFELTKEDDGALGLDWHCGC